MLIKETEMSGLKKFGDAGYVAEIKYDHIMNIVRQAEKCPNITRIMLFGSSTEERCSERSDIDIAVFGKKQRGRYILSGEFSNFQKSIYLYDLRQDYDVLYYVEGKHYDDAVIGNINKGIEIYRKAAS